MKNPHFFPGHFYHLYNRANGDENLFREPENFRYFLKRFHEKTAAVADTAAYCLMPNHFHLLVKIKQAHVLEAYIHHRAATQRKPVIPRTVLWEERHHFMVQRTFHNFFSGYAKAFNKYHNRKGSLLQQNTKRKIVMDMDYLLSAIVYIHRNPVNHQFTSKPEDWPYSSFPDYFYDPVNNPLQQRLIEWFGGREALLKAHVRPAILSL